MEPEVKELLKQAKDLVASKNYEQLLINAKEIVRLDRKNYNGYVFYGLGAAHQNQRDVSEKAYRKAIELNPTQPTAHQGLVELFTMIGDHAKLADAITDLLALLKPDHPKYVEYLHKRAVALQQQPPKAALAAEAWRALLAHPGAEEHRLQAARHLFDFAVAAEKAELQAETEQRFQARAKKTPPAEQEALRQSIEREVRTALFSRNDIERQLQRLMELSATSEFHVKAIQRLQARLALAPNPAARVECRAAIRQTCAGAVSRQPSFFAVETLLGFLEEEHFADEAAPVPALAPKAARFYRLLMHAHPDRPLSGLGFAHLFLQQGKSEDALALLELSLRKAPQSLQGWLALGHAQLDAALYQAASDTVAKLRAELQKRAADDAALPAAQTATDLIWARANHRGLGKKDEARATYAAILQRLPQHVEALRGLAQLAADADDLPAALDYYQRLIALRPTDADAVAESGHVLLRGGRLPEAIERLSHAVSLKPSAAMAHHWLGVAFWRSGGALRTDKSKTEFLLSAQQRPDFAANFTFLGHFYREVDKDEARARRCYQKAVALDAQESEAGVALADMYLAAGQETLAVALYKDLTGRSTRVLWAWLRLAVVQERDGEHEEAAASFQAALRLDASNTVCWRGLAEAYRKQGKFMASLKAFSRLLELEPKSAYGRYQVAAIELLLGLRAKSLAAFEGLLKELPNYVPALKGAGEAQLAIAREQYAQGFSARAVESAQRAAELLATCAAQQANLRSVWKAYGDAELLRAHLTHLQTGKPASKDQELELIGSAIKAYKAALALDPKSSASLQDLAVARYQRAVALRAQAAKGAALGDEAQAELAQAEEGLKEALKVAPASAHLWRSLGVVARAPALQQHAFIAALEANTKSGAAWADLGHFYLRHGAQDLAARAYAEAQLLEPHAPGGWLGQALLEELSANARLAPGTTHAAQAAELRRAKAAYDQAVQTHATPLACLGAAHTSFVCGDHEAAAAAVRRFMQLEGATPQALNLLGLVLEAQGLYPAAVAAFTEGLALLATFPKQTADAKLAYETTLNASGVATSGTPEVLSANLGRALYFAGKGAEAVAALSRADLGSRTNLLFLAASHALARNPAEAFKVAERALGVPGSVADGKALHMLVARLWHAQGDAAKALNVAAKAAEETKAPALWELFYAVASHASDAKATRFAVPHLPNTPEAGMLRSVQAQIEHNPQRARSALLSALHCHPTDATLWRRLASLTLDHVAAPTAALASLSAHLAPRANAAEDFRLQAALLLAQGKSSRMASAALFRAACSAAQRCLRIAPQDADARYLLAAAAVSLARRTKQLHHWERAEQAIRVALGALSADALTRTRPALLAAQADCLLFLGRAKEAAELATKLATSDGMRAASQVQLARCRAAQRDVSGAVALYKTALKEAPTADRWTELAALYEHASQWAAAELCHRQAIALRAANSPRRMSSLLRLGHHFIARRKWDEALAALSEAAALNELHPTLLLLQGLALARQNAAADAEWCLQAVVAMEPAMPLASLLLSELHLAGGNVAAAESDAFYERDNAPDSDGALLQLAKVALASKQADGALSYLLRAAHMNPARGDYWMELNKLKAKPAPSAKK